MELELESVGYHAEKLTNVCWHETFENVALRRAAVVAHDVKQISCKRVMKVNKVTFQLEEGKTYRYSRQICVAPRREDSRWFKVIGNEMEFLDEQSATASRILGERFRSHGD